MGEALRYHNCCSCFGFTTIILILGVLDVGQVTFGLGCKGFFYHTVRYGVDPKL